MPRKPQFGNGGAKGGKRLSTPCLPHRCCFQSSVQNESGFCNTEHDGSSGEEHDDEKDNGVDPVGDLMKEIMSEMNVIRKVINEDERVGVVYEGGGDDMLGALTVTVKVAMDSGACASTLNPDDLPAGVVPSGNPSGAVGPPWSQQFPYQKIRERRDEDEEPADEFRVPLAGG